MLWGWGMCVTLQREMVWVLWGGYICVCEIPRAMVGVRGRPRWMTHRPGSRRPSSPRRRRAAYIGAPQATPAPLRACRFPLDDASGPWQDAHHEHDATRGMGRSA